MSQAGAGLMRREIGEIAEAVARLSAPESRARSRAEGAALREFAPVGVATVARGSSDHAASFLAYATQLVLKRPVASIGPSVATVYGAQLVADRFAVFAISQSGASDDLVRLSDMLRGGGARVIALTNTPASRLGRVADAVLPVEAGLERAVAASKSFVNSVVAGLWLLADWAEDTALAHALSALPEALQNGAMGQGFDGLADALVEVDRVMVLGRGAGLGLAQEMALKLLETCRIHASAYSGAEALHGPSALLTDGYPVIALTTGTQGGMAQALSRLKDQGACVFALPEAQGTGHPLVDPLLDLPGFYRMAEQLSRRRGMDPDRPAHLSKETKTL